MPVEHRDPPVRHASGNPGGRGDLTKAPLSLHDLRRRIDAKAKAEPTGRFWGLGAHGGQRETLWDAYRLATDKDGARGRDGVTLEAIEAAGVATLLDQIRAALGQGTYRPRRYRRQALPPGCGTGGRVLAIPARRDRVVPGALTLIVAPRFEAALPEGSDGYRPQRSAHDAIERVAEARVHEKTRVLDIARQASVDHRRHHRRWAHGAPRVNEPAVRRVVKRIRKHTGKKGVAPGAGRGPR